MIDLSPTEVKILTTLKNCAEPISYWDTWVIFGIPFSDFEWGWSNLYSQGFVGYKRNFVNRREQECTFITQDGLKALAEYERAK